MWTVKRFSVAYRTAVRLLDPDTWFPFLRYADQPIYPKDLIATLERLPGDRGSGSRRRVRLPIGEGGQA
jgi:hypothetical protein